MSMQDPVRIHVNQPAIRANQQHRGARRPVIAVLREDMSDLCNDIEIQAPDGTVVARMVYRPDQPLAPSGATVWIEVEHGCAVRRCPDAAQITEEAA